MDEHDIIIRQLQQEDRLRKAIAVKYVRNNIGRKRSIKVHYRHYRLRYSRPITLDVFTSITFEILYPRDNYLVQPRK